MRSNHTGSQNDFAIFLNAMAAACRTSRPTLLPEKSQSNEHSKISTFPVVNEKCCASDALYLRASTDDLKKGYGSAFDRWKSLYRRFSLRHSSATRVNASCAIRFNEKQQSEKSPGDAGPHQG